MEKQEQIPQISFSVISQTFQGFCFVPQNTFFDNLAQNVPTPKTL